ncbi:hypothetical protein NBRC116592_18310 [Colwellia sp. KU-HH00111]|uniref:glycosyltransferase family 25 protein n=1 Tax=Colwellia sp. KU-HH00111 TaxID=3127652 RepID=UPI0031042548
MKIYVLTVGNEQRLAHIAKQLQDVEYELIYSESEEQLKEYNQTYAQRQLRFTTRTLGLGEMGAWRIHVRAWEKVAQNECPCLLIEDNALIHSNLVERLPQILEDTQNYGMISFAEHPRRSAETSPYEVNRWGLPLYMYGVTPFYADRALARVNKLGYTFAVDSWLRRKKITQFKVFAAPYKIASRTPRSLLSSYAQKNIPKKSYKLSHMLHRIVNKIKYRT